MSLLRLLSSEEEPPFTLYMAAIEAIVTTPRHIIDLAGEETRASVVFNLANRSNRLSKVFDQLRQRQAVTPGIAAQIVDFFVAIIDDLNEILDEQELIEILLAALEASIPCHPISLRNLATVLLRCHESIPERMATSRRGNSIISNWVTAPNIAFHSVATLAAWTDRLVSRTASCPGQHGLGETISKWDSLSMLKTELQELQRSYAEKAENTQSVSSARALPSLTNMKVLSKSDKKSQNAQLKNTSRYIPQLSNDTASLLQTFDLRIPGSERMLRANVEALETKETINILQTITRGFPCSLCYDALTCGTASISDRAQTIDKKAPEIGSSLDLNMLGRQVGVWKVLLSSRAIKRMQDIGHRSQLKIIQDNLHSLASGSWRLQRAGSEDQRKKLRIPLAITKCGKGPSLLWQVDIASAEGRQTRQQVIKVWDLVDSARMKAAVDRVIVIQEMYPQETVDRCRERPTQTNNTCLPRQFNIALGDTDIKAPTVDIRSIDRSIIDMTNKFYAFTKPVMDSVLANDLRAEFPFDLSEDEARVISHFQTASLILGRSGTGKTTCLVFKLVGKYLASQALEENGTARQVLLTRSSFLAAKLRTYTSNLLRTLTDRSRASHDPQETELNASSPGQELSTTQNVFSLSDFSFPLILTFDQFLTILENTVSLSNENHVNGRRMIDNSRGLSNISEALIDARQKMIETKKQRPRQLVNFYAFKVDYWPKFSTYLTRNLAVELVFAEIMGTLKGSNSSKDSLAPLTRAQYLERSYRVSPTFVLEDERSRVYDIFESYESLKLGRGDVDYVDRVVQILDVVRRDPILSHRLRSCFDEVYVDEVQDQRCLDIELLLNLINDGRGLHFAGDTAQAISQDATFRFADAKALIYTHFTTASDFMNQTELARPTTFALATNYRSHQGILSLAYCVMQMLWNGFPETIDKMSPEIGRLCGPMPLVFLGCSFEILLTNKVGLVNLSDSAIDFGAEQVILVRDESAKAKLQTRIGDAALVLTILQSKGMEFDDVILWDFFTALGSENPAGLRILRELSKDSDCTFDARKHARMCSELKHLYVAITRARIKLLVVESLETVVAPAIELLTRDVPQPLIEVVRPSDTNFEDKVKELKAGGTTKPKQWSSRGNQLLQQQSYKEALICFRKAGDNQGLVTTEAFISEEKGRCCGAAGDMEGFTRNLCDAVEGFSKAGRIREAVDNLVRLDKPKDAAELWYKQGDHIKAAPLFEHAKLFDKASMCYNTSGRVDEAAYALRQGNLFDDLISYVNQNHDSMSPRSIRGHNRFCRLLLKQNRISIKSRELAIKMLGSPEEQEAVFVQYEMNEQLTELYSSQDRRRDLFYLLLRMDRLDDALRTARDTPFTEVPKDFEDDTKMVLDYVRVRHIQGHDLSSAPDQTLSEGLNTKMLQRAQEWDFGLQLLRNDPNQIPTIMDMLIRKFMCLHATLIFAEGVPVLTLDRMPFDTIREAVDTVKKLLSEPNEEDLVVLFLLTGVFKYPKVIGRYSLLSWSPLRAHQTNSSVETYTKMAISWLVNKLGPAVLNLDKRLRGLWGLKWPRKCLRFLVKGFCPGQQQPRPCTMSHARFESTDYRDILKDYFRVNRLFCELTMIYYRRIMPVEFQSNFLKIRRHWLECLYRQLTYLSPFEQDTAGLVRAQSELFHGNEFKVVASSLEELIFHKIGRELPKISDVSSLFEQIQLSQNFGGRVEYRLLNDLKYRLPWLHCHVGGMPTEQFLFILGNLQGDVYGPNARSFRANLISLFSALERANSLHLMSFHALLAIYEYLAAYLLMRTQPNAFIVPKSWVDLHLPWLVLDGSSQSMGPVPEIDVDAYRSCLLWITASFRRILGRLNGAIYQKAVLQVGGKPHSWCILTRRNIELLTITMINMAKNSALPRGFGEEWAATMQFISTGGNDLQDLNTINADGLCGRLHNSFAMYGDKNSLVIVTQKAGQRNAFTDIQNRLRLKSLTWEDVRTSGPASSQLPLTGKSASTTQPADEERAAKIIQNFWRKSGPRFRARQAHLQTPLGKVITEFLALSASLSTPLTVRKAFFSRGVSIRQRLPRAREALDETRKKTLAYIENVDVSTTTSEAVNDVLDELDWIEGALRSAAQRVSREWLRDLIEEWDAGRLEEVLVEVEEALGEVEGRVKKADEIMESMGSMTSM